MDDYTQLGLLQDIFTRQAALTPDHTAVVCQNGIEMTYRDLDAVTDDLATFLQLKGVVPDTCVGICMDRCLEYVIAYIAILKAGGAYLPLEPAYPVRQLHEVLIDAAPKYVLGKDPYIDNMDVMQESVLDMNNSDWLKLVKQTNGDRVLSKPVQTLDSLAYIVYSSGTTGKPKGIQCPHRGAVFSYTWRHENYPYRDKEREAANVFFVWEMFRPLCKGSTLYVVPDTVIYDPPELAKFIKANEITRQLFTPSLFEALIEYNVPDIQDCMKTMKTIVFCGEVVTTSLLDRSIKLFPWIQFVNLYSISESHDVAACDLSQYYATRKDDLMSRKFCPVGKLLPGVKVHILGDDMSVKPVGVSGEIHIGGPTLAVGYLNRPDLNQNRFVTPREELNIKETKLYKSGDWGYILSDGSMEICGRCDSMHKIRGYSVEVQAIEATMLELEMVNSCVVVVNGDEGDDKFLVAYIVPEGVTTKRKIREALKLRIPFYMIPSYFVLLNSIPILPTSGKLDKKKLPPYDSQPDSGESQSDASTETERRLLAMWIEILGVKHIDCQDSFFDLGGHSLLAARLLNKISNVLEVTLTVQDLFKHSSITSMSKLIDSVRSGSDMPTAESQEVDLIKEVEQHNQTALMNMDMQLRAFWRMFQYRPNWKNGSVLLTGASGFLGSFLLKDLLLNTQTHVHCIIRTGAEQNAMDKLLSNLASYQIIDDVLTIELVKQRVSCISGDISLLRMGLSVDDYGYLLTEIDFIIHAAAYVNLLYPYKALVAANVMGTENMIVFACTSKIKPILYISTDAVFPTCVERAPETADMTPFASQLTDGYSQTKWVAEQLVLKASQCGLPVTIYRCGNISGEQTTTAWNQQDFILSILQAITTLGVAPDIEWEVEMTPVDFISQVIVQLSQRVSDSLGKIYHLIQPIKTSLKMLIEAMMSCGYKIKTVSFPEWIELLKCEEQALPSLRRLLDSPLLQRESFESKRTFKNKNVFRILPELNLQYPVITPRLLQHYLTGLQKADLIPRTMSSNTGSLSGKVAVVTGASSGIGEAIARHLAAAGASVSMGARREGRLEEINSSIIESGKTCRYTVCDVTNVQQVKKLVEDTEKEFGPIDILVNNAGIMYYTEMISLHEEEWEKQIDINCKGVVNGVGAVIDGMSKRKSGHIINMSSDAGRRGFAGLAVYSGTKFFVEGFSQSLRHELSGFNVKVTTIQPGDVKSEIGNFCTDPEAFKKYDVSGHPDIMLPDDIARAVVYVASQPPNVAVNEVLVEPTYAPI